MAVPEEASRAAEIGFATATVHLLLLFSNREEHSRKKLLFVRTFKTNNIQSKQLTADQSEISLTSANVQANITTNAHSFNNIRKQLTLMHFLRRHFQQTNR
jgi:hypothetical protein